MRKCPSIIVFLALVLSSVAASVGTYKTTEDQVVADLNHALTKTLTKMRQGWITQDTIRAYKQLQATMESPVALNIESDTFRRNLRMKDLRSKAIITFSLADNNVNEGSLQSDTVVWSDPSLGVSVAFKAQAQCSIATIFSMSDQRLPATLWAATLLWLIFSSVYFHRNHTAISNAICHGGLTLSDEYGTFRNANGDEVRFTPMQRQLMTLFFHSKNMLITKEEICATLWPKKDDASETLYTLIRRLKPIVEQNSDLHIKVDRGRAYQLVCR